jgi:enoyl-CoA hydratase/carnithine racemase
MCEAATAKGNAIGEARTMYQDILVEDDGRIGIVTLNRPDRLNAATFGTTFEIRHATFDVRREIRAIVVTGAGRAFCVGMDLGADVQTVKGQRHPAEDLVPATDAPYWEMATPIIAAMNGVGVGGGLTLALQFDFRVMAEDAKYGFPFNRRGLLPEMGATWVLPRLIGGANATDLLLTGRIFSGTEAKALGLANEALPADKVLERSLQIANDIADNLAPVSTAVTRRLIAKNRAEPDRAAAEQFETELFYFLAAQEDAVEGFESFFEKRTPQWKMDKNRDFPSKIWGEG